MRTTFLSTALLLLLAGGPARAQTPAKEPEGDVEDEAEPDPKQSEAVLSRSELLPPPSRPAPTEVAYGGYILVADGVALGTVLLAANSDNAGLGYLSLATYLIAPPVVHLAHGNPGRSLGSLALRVGAPLTGGYVGCMLDRGECFGGLALGLLGGYLTAVVVDAAVLAYETVEPPTTARPRVMPYLAPIAHGGTLGFQGIF